MRLTLQAERPPVKGPVHTLVSCNGDGPTIASIDFLHVSKSTTGRTAFRSEHGMLLPDPEMDPHPESTVFPVGFTPACGRLIFVTLSVIFRGFFSFSRAMS